jgi:hypothetical protein
VSFDRPHDGFISQSEKKDFLWLGALAQSLSHLALT